MDWLQKVSPVPAFPSYSGPYKVGSVDVEIPVAELESPSPAPKSSPSTVAFRIFYPCEDASSEPPAWWVPAPQRGYMKAYAQFLGANWAFSSAFSYLSHLLNYVSIPVHRNATLLSPPTMNKRWPVMMFSHGLGGSRNAYSHICGSISSHGVVVIAPEHRDGSAPITYIRATEETASRIIRYRFLPHEPTPEVYQARNEQLGIRLFELGLLHDAALKIDEGAKLTNLNVDKKHDVIDILPTFKNKLHVHTPGAIAWAGHSFGGASVYQFVKSVFWKQLEGQADYTPLFVPSETSVIQKQITPQTPVILLDMWCLPLKSPDKKWLWNKPMPCYESKSGGSNLLAVLSEAFVKWQPHFRETQRALSEDPSSMEPKHTKPGPRFFYPAQSAHLSQSDFGVLFPWATKKFFKADDPERTLRLNTRAILQVLRGSGIEVAQTSYIDMEEEPSEKGNIHTSENIQDWKILDINGAVKGWISLTTDVEESADEIEDEEIHGKGPKGEDGIEGEILNKVGSTTSS